MEENTENQTPKKGSFWGGFFLGMACMFLIGLAVCAGMLSM